MSQQYATYFELRRTPLEAYSLMSYICRQVFSRATVASQIVMMMMIDDDDDDEKIEYVYATYRRALQETTYNLRRRRRCGRRLPWLGRLNYGPAARRWPRLWISPI